MNIAQRSMRGSSSCGPRRNCPASRPASSIGRATSAFSRSLDQRLQAIATTVQAHTIAGSGGDDADARPPMRVEFAGGHRVAVETEALVRRESIQNTVGSLAVILPVLFFVFRSPWL